jgi:hypothetical protein
MRYSCSFDAVAVSAAQDLFELTAPADAICVILSCRVGQTSDYGDAEAEGLQITLRRGNGATTGSGGSAGTEVALEAGFGTAGGVVEINNTTQMTAGGGSLEVLSVEPFNAQVGWLYQPTPEERVVVSPSDLFTVALDSAPSDALTMSGTLIWEEIGG